MPLTLVPTEMHDDLSVTTAKLANQAVTPTKLSQPLTAGTSQASTSGTSIDFTSIPSWVKRITVMFNGVSTSGSSFLQAQLGSGSVQTTGYVSYATYTGGVNQTGGTTATSGFILEATAGAPNVRSGHLVFTLQGANTWVGSLCLGFFNSSLIYSSNGGGAVTLSGALDRVRITTVNGTDTFDAGAINILYE